MLKRHLAAVFSLFLAYSGGLRAQELAGIPKCKPAKAKLFQSAETLNLGIEYTSFKKGEYSKEKITRVGEQATAIGVKFDIRGKSRRAYCEFPPLRLTWLDKAQLEGTPFEKVHGKSMKLVVHCEYTSGNIEGHPEANQEVIHEYALYKILKALELPTYEVRLVKVNYLKNAETLEGMGFLMEPHASLEKRCGLTLPGFAVANGALAHADPRVKIPGLLSRLILDAPDFIMWGGHNSEVMVNSANEVKMIVPYDFNDSRMVNSRHRNNGPFFSAYGFYDDPFEVLLKGPFEREGAFQDGGPGWQAELKRQAEAILARKQAAYEVLSTIPLNEERKSITRRQLDFAFGKIQQMNDKLL